MPPPINDLNQIISNASSEGATNRWKLVLVARLRVKTPELRMLRVEGEKLKLIYQKLEDTRNYNSAHHKTFRSTSNPASPNNRIPKLNSIHSKCILSHLSSLKLLFYLNLIRSQEKHLGKRRRKLRFHNSRLLTRNIFSSGYCPCCSCPGCCCC